MGTKYSSNSISGYNATPPSDDGTVSEANKVKWSTVKTKLSDPVKTLAETINTELATHFDNGPTAVTTNTTLGASHYNQVIETSGSGVTLTLTDAATLTAGWYCEIRVTGSNNVTLTGATTADTCNGVAFSTATYTLVPGFSGKIVVNAAANGFLVLNESINRGNDGAVTRIKKGGKGQELWIPQDIVAGLEITIGTDTDHDLDIAVGECSDSTNAYMITLSAGVTRQFDIAYATGNGGLSSSLTLTADTTYYVHAIINSSGTHDIAFDTSATAANLVTDHSITAYRPLMTLTTDASANIDATTLNYVGYIQGQRIISGTLETWTRIATSGDLNGASTADFTLDSTSYNHFWIKIRDIVASSTGPDVGIRISQDTGSTFKSGASDYSYAGTYLDNTGTWNALASTGNTHIVIAQNPAGAVYDISGDVFIDAIGGPYSGIRWQMTQQGTSTTVMHYLGSGRYDTDTNAFDAIRVFLTSSTWNSGQIELWGLPK